MTKLSFEALKNWVLLNRLAAGSPRRFAELLKEGMAPVELMGRIETENLFGKADALKKIKAEFDGEREIELCEAKGIRLLALSDPDYPAPLKTIFDPPIVLYVQGDLSELDEAALAVVGSRHPSFYGLTHARKFSRELAAAGLSIVSGLAKGVDQAAHEGALAIPYGRTLAVLGCGMDMDYPKGSGKLRDRIIERGAILSEYPLGTNPYAENFPTRNRIISGLALGVLVVEAHQRSGSLITAHQALEQGRDVFAIPGPIDQLTSRGTHHLIKEGAALVESAQDILEALASQLGFVSKEQGKVALAPEKERGRTEILNAVPSSEEADLPFGEDHLSSEEKSLMGILTVEPLAFDEIAARSELPPHRLSGLLTRWELGNRIQKTREGRFALKVR